jgi:hypothetical protein
MLEDVGFVARRRAAGGSGVWGDAGVDENVAAGRKRSGPMGTEVAESWKR